MKKIMYGTIFLFVFILIVVMIVSSMHPVETVRYENGVIIDETD